MSVWTNVLYSRRESAEIIGMSNWIGHSTLEKTVYKVLQQIPADTCEENSNRTTAATKKRRLDVGEILGGKTVNR